MGVDKTALVVGGATLLGSVARAAAAAGAGRVVVAGPPRPQLAAGVVWAQEDPPGAGPVPALRRGLAEVTAPVIVLLAADLPFLRAAQLRALLAARPAGGGVMLLDDAGHPQWLASCWDTGLLRRLAAGYRGSSLRGMLGRARPAGLRLDAASGPPPWLDCDTPDELRRARAWTSEEAPR